MKKLKVLTVVVLSLLIFCNSFVVFAQNKTEKTVFYFDAPTGFTDSNTVVCTLWDDGGIYYDAEGEYLGSNLYRFIVENIDKYSNMVFCGNFPDFIERTSFLYGSEGKFPEDDYEARSDEFYDKCIDINGKVFSDTIKYYDGFDDEFNSFGRWFDYSTWERKVKFDNYITEMGGKLPNVLKSNWPDLWYRYRELYSDNKNYILAFGSGDEKSDTIACDRFGNYELKQNESYSPYAFGYYVYLLKEEKFVTLREAVDMGVPNIEKVFSEYGLGKAVRKTTVSLSKSTANVYVKGNTTIKATVMNGVGSTTYKSNNTKVAKVTSSGKIIAVKSGTAKITVTNNKVSKIFTVKVRNPKLNKTFVTLAKGKSTTLKITGKVGTAKFTTTNRRVATVNANGKITVNKKAKKGCSCSIRVKTNGITLKCKVRVK